MVFNTLLWYVVLALAGWLAFPLAYRMLAFLPDRGWALSRPLGLLLWGYAFWMLTSLHVLQNNAGGVTFALLIVAGLSAWALWRGGWRELTGWLRGHRTLVLTSELLFLLAFVLMAIIRAANPDASGTEKPMEIAFINAILRSPVFPPSDPWLSGYAISYYYFGYVMVAMLAHITGTPGAVAFNLGLISWFALTAVAAYSLLYNLLSLRGPRWVANHLWALLAPLFVLIISNLEGFLELLHARGVFWQGQNSTFWRWLNIQELVQPPTPPYEWGPERVGGIWWWRASRVLQDFDMNGQSREIIDEFPAFSYLLGDLHPHVLAMPFALLAASLALNIYLRRHSGERPPSLLRWVREPEFWLVAVALGGLAFLNTWDFPIYVALFAAAATLAGFLRFGWKAGLLYDFVETAFALGFAGAVLYLPFYVGFSSQANGLLPSLVFFTRGVYFWLMFGSLLAPVAFWLVWQWARGGSLNQAVQGLAYSVGLLASLWLFSTLYALLRLQSDPNLAGIYGASPGAPLIQASFVRRMEMPGAWLSLLLLIGLTWGLFQVLRCHPAEQVDARPADEHPTGTPADPFVLLLVLVGLGLVLFPEYFYLRDQFGWRMNTIFKFAFQAWIMLAIAAAFASAVLWEQLRSSVAKYAFRVVWLALVAMALVYPLYGVWNRANGFSPSAWTLDGADYIQRYSPEDMDGIRWLQQAAYGVVAEAVGGSYTGYARVSTFSGLPGVLGWPGHESQWRGGALEIGSREPDIEQLYRARTWDQISPILAKYNIRYVYLGPLEKSAYRPNTAVFDRYLKPVYQNPQVTIYEVPQ